MIKITKIAFPVLVSAILSTLACSCATTGSPAGGRTDYDPPVPLVYSPGNYSTDFNAKKIEVTFDERIKYKDLSKSLVVSPPIDNIIQKIKPSSLLPSKKMEIDLSEVTLLPNTTYTFNFGNSVTDNHEGTAIPNFKYVFSTGDKIDSLVVGGIIEDAYLKKFDPLTVVMLYRVDSTFNDSTVFKQRPMYFTRLADKKDSTFRIDNVAPGTYQLVAMVDEASNMKYDQSKDKIAFFPRHLELKEPSGQGYLLRLAQARRSYKVYQGLNQQQGLIQIAIDGLEPGGSVRRIFPALADTARDYYIFNENHDTLRYWFTGNEKDSILFTVKRPGKTPDTVNAKIRKPAAVEFARRIATKTLDLDGNIYLETNKPIGQIDPGFIHLTDKDSLARPFTLELDSTGFSRIKVVFKIAPDNKYSLTVLPQAIRSILGETAKDTAKASFKTLTPDDYGTYVINPISFREYPLIFQLTTLDDKPFKEMTVTREGNVKFTLVPPGKYKLRVIYDTNGNGKWDTVDYLKHQQPERMKYLDTPIEVRAMWEDSIDW